MKVDKFLDNVRDSETSESYGAKYDIILEETRDTDSNLDKNNIMNGVYYDKILGKLREGINIPQLDMIQFLKMNTTLNSVTGKYELVDSVGARNGPVQPGRCYKTDGANDIIDFERISLGSSHRIKFNAKIPLTSDCVITADTGEIYSAIRIQPSIPRIAYQNISGSAVSFTYTPDDKIHTYEFVRVNTSVTLVIDGVDIETQTLTHNAVLYVNRLFARNPTPEYSDSFSMNNLEFYDENENLVHQWKMDEGVGDITYDSVTPVNYVSNSEFNNTDDWNIVNALISTVDNELLVTDDGDFSSTYTSISTVIGTKYKITYEAIDSGAGIFKSGWGNAPPNGSNYGSTLLQSDDITGFQSFEFTATSPTTYLVLGSTGAETATYKNYKCSTIPVNGEIKNADLSTFHATDNSFDSFQNEEGYTTSLKFNGYNDYVNLGNDTSLDATNALTIYSRVKSEDFGTGYRSLAIKFKGGRCWALETNNNVIDFSVSGDGNIWDLVTHLGSINIADGKVHDIVATYDGTIGKLYVDGILNQSGGSTGSISVETSIVTLGANTDVGFMSGLLLDSKLWGRALTQIEVEHLTNNIKVSDADLLYNADFKNVTSSTLPDSSNNNNNGIIDGCEILNIPIRTDGKDVLGNTPTYKGLVRYNADLVESNCTQFDGSSYIRFDKENIDLSRVDYFDFEMKAMKDSSGIINLSQYGGATNSAGIMWYSNGYISVYAKYDTTSSASYFFNEYDNPASIRAVYDGTLTGNDRVKLYINDSEVSLDYSGDFPATMPGFAQEFRIGKLSSLVSDGKMYNVTRRNRAGAIINNWNFAEGAGDTVYDTVPINFGDELVTNGNFDNELNGWVNNDLNTFEIDNGKLHITGDNVSNKYGGTSMPFYIDHSKKYRFEADVIKNSGTDDWDISLRRTLGGTFLKLITNTETTGKISVDFELDDSGDVYIQFTTRGYFDGVIDNITINEIISKTANGTIIDADLSTFHAKDNQRPHNLLDGFSTSLMFDGVDDYVEFPTIDISNSSYLHISMDIEKHNTTDSVCFQQFLDNDSYIQLLWHTNGRIYAVIRDDSLSYGYVEFSDTGRIKATLVFQGNETSNANRLQLSINGVTQTLTFIGTIPSVTPNLSSVNPTLGLQAGGYVKGIVHTLSARGPTGVVLGDWRRVNGNKYIDTVDGENGIIYGCDTLCIPAQLGNTGLDALGNTLSNPSGKFHNNAETLIQEPVAPALIKADAGLDFLYTAEVPNKISFKNMQDSLGDVYNNHNIFMDVSKAEQQQIKNFLVYEDTLTDDETDKVLKFINDPYLKDENYDFILDENGDYILNN